MKKPYWLPLFWLLAVLLLPGCDVASSDLEVKRVEQPEPADTWFPLTLGDQTIRVQLAIAQGERQHGLMQRHDLGENDGMLFLFEHPQRMSFWMENTPLALSIGYFTSNGMLMEIYLMEPYDRTSVPSERRDLQFALEMKQGWFRHKNVKPGARLNLDQLRAAVIARGFEPADYGL